MKVVDELLARRPRDSIYHYTTQLGLLGIIKERKIWATMSRYLNDVSEFVLAQEVARQVVADRKKSERDSSIQKLLDDLKGAIDNSGINVCVCAFSANGDSLSQWRAYSGGGTGYAIGFDPEKLRNAAGKSGYILAPCIYEEGEQLSLMNRIVQETLDENVALLQEGTYLEDLPGGNFSYYLNRYALIIKNVAFKEEEEWRLISRPTSYKREGVSFRSGLSTIIPYQEIPITNEEDKLPINDVIVGPTPRPDEATQAVRGLLISRQEFSLKPPHVTNSVIPYCNW